MARASGARASSRARWDAERSLGSELGASPRGGSGGDGVTAGTGEGGAGAGPGGVPVAQAALKRDRAKGAKGASRMASLREVAPTPGATRAFQKVRNSPTECAFVGWGVDRL